MDTAEAAPRIHRPEQSPKARPWVKAVTVLRAFNHEHNASEVARQEYEFAKQHYREVCSQYDGRCRNCQSRFLDASERLEAARERWLRVMVS
ncbi:MAG TPA: hypothetical protein VH092_08450 [Urbifossiella sp.]|nr:hypothetical protein [Urbifossiella sp.]